jgi:hypothetical protein
MVIPFHSLIGRDVAGAGGVLVGTHAAGVDADDPFQLANRIGLGLGVGQQLVPGAVPAPAHEAVIAGLPRAVAVGEVPPGRAGAQLPQDPIDHPAMATPATAAALVAWQQRRKLRPCPIGELSATDHQLAPSTSSRVSGPAEAPNAIRPDMP